MDNSWPAGGRSARFDLEVRPFVWWGSRSHLPRRLFLCLVQGLPAEPRPLPVRPGTPMPRLEGSVTPSVHPELSCRLLYVHTWADSPKLECWALGPTWGTRLLHQAPCLPVERPWGDLTGGPPTLVQPQARVCPPQRSSGFGKGAGGPGAGTTGSGLGPSTCPLGPKSRETQGLHSEALGGCRATPTST